MHTGDFTGATVLAELKRYAPVTAVQGNMDDAGLRAGLSLRVEAEVEGLRVGVVHDAGPRAGRHERLLEAFPGCDVIAYGHTHMPEVKRAGDVWILNPGSPTERRRAAGVSSGLAHPCPRNVRGSRTPGTLNLGQTSIFRTARGFPQTGCDSGWGAAGVAAARRGPD